MTLGSNHNELSLEARLGQLCADACGISLAEFNPKRRFLEYGLDSVRALELVSAVEETFDISIEDETASRLKTLDDLTTCVRTRLAQSPERGL